MQIKNKMIYIITAKGGIAVYIVKRHYYKNNARKPR